jgi:hypothetical protein
MMDSLQLAVRAQYSAFDADDHRPHFGVPSDELREIRATTRDGYIGEITNAWKSPTQPAQSSNNNNRATRDADADPMRKRTEARDAYVRNLTTAWRRTPHKDAAQPDSGSTLAEWQAHARGPLPGQSGEKLDPNAAGAIERQLERWRGRDLSELAAEAEAMRRKNHAEFAERLSNAWRGGK